MSYYEEKENVIDKAREYVQFYIGINEGLGIYNDDIGIQFARAVVLEYEKMADGDDSRAFWEAVGECIDNREYVTEGKGWQLV